MRMHAKHVQQKFGFKVAGANMLKSILFDLDGVLADSRRSAAKNIVISLAEFGHRAKMREVYAHLTGITTRQIIWELFPKMSEKECRGVRHAVARNDPKVWKLIKRTKLCALLPGLAKKYKLAVVTNRRTSGVGVAKHLRIAKYFKAVVTVLDGKPKPAPDMVKFALKKLRVRKSEAVFFGDNEIDMLAGKRAGVISVRVNEKTGASGLAAIIERQEKRMQAR